MTQLEQDMAFQMRAYKISDLFEREYRFHPTRKWRLDFAYVEKKIGIELQGGIFGRKSGHNTGVGIRNGMGKLNEAQRLGWRVFYFYVDDVKSGKAINFIIEILREYKRGEA